LPPEPERCRQAWADPPGALPSLPPESPEHSWRPGHGGPRLTARPTPVDWRARAWRLDGPRSASVPWPPARAVSPWCREPAARWPSAFDREAAHSA
jgi:hypothetical protein